MRIRVLMAGALLGAFLNNLAAAELMPTPTKNDGQAWLALIMPADRALVQLNRRDQGSRERECTDPKLMVELSAAMSAENYAPDRLVFAASTAWVRLFRNGKETLRIDFIGLDRLDVSSGGAVFSYKVDPKLSATLQAILRKHLRPAGPA